MTTARGVAMHSYLAKREHKKDQKREVKGINKQRADDDFLQVRQCHTSVLLLVSRLAA